MSEKYFEEELDDLVRYIEEKRPYLIAILRNYDSSVERLFFTDSLSVNTDLANIEVKVKKALAVN